MESDPTERSGERLSRFPLDDPLRVEIYAMLRNLVGPGPAQFYRDACRLLDADFPVDSVTHLVGHCVREIESALRQVLKASVVANSDSAGAGQKAQSGENKHDTNIRACLAALEIDEKQDIAKAWLTYAGGLHRRAHRHALNPPRPLDSEFIDFFERMESVLHAVLRRFETKFGSSFQLIDELIGRATPTTKDAERLKQDVPNTLVTHYRFFEGIPDGRWIDSLEEEGFFSSPPSPEVETGCPSWPQSRYLARVAPDEPDRVKDVFLGLPSTENVRVYEDMARAAQTMPAGHAVELASRIKDGLDSPYYSQLALESGRLVPHLAAHEQTESAIDLATDLLALISDSVEEDVTSLAAISEPRPRFQPPEYYKEVLDMCVEPLVDNAGLCTVGMLCGLLTAALSVRLDLDEGEDDVSLPYEDCFYMDRPAIEDHTYNRERGLNEGYTGTLLAATRDAAESLCERDGKNVAPLVERLEVEGSETFDRLALHLLRLYSKAPGARELAVERLINRASTASPGVFHEYALLLRERFPLLSKSERDSILQAFLHGPTSEELEKMREIHAVKFQEESGAPGELEDYLSRYRDRWRYKRLAILDKLLPDSVRNEYERLAGTYADPDGDTLFYAEPRVRAIVTRSPKSSQELAQMEIADVVSFLRDFEPGDGWDEPDERDVGRELRTAAASQPERFSVSAKLFEKTSLAYVAELLGGLKDAFQQQGDDSGEAQEPLMEWSPILALCRWIIEHGELTTTGDNHEQHENKDYVDSLLALKQAAWLLQDGLLKKGELPFELRGQVWSVLEPMMAHPEPMLDYEEEELRHDRPHITPNHLAINTVRGVAAHTILSYILWVQCNLGQVDKDTDSVTGEEERIIQAWCGLEDCPEASEILERHLDPAVEPTRTIRSVYGKWLPTLVALDRGWVEERVVEIFPTDSSLVNLEVAAWETYVVQSPVYDEVFDLLRAEYGRAIERLGRRECELGPHSPDTYLAEHLMILYLRGKVDFGDQDGLLERFYELASDELRGRSTSFTGRILRNNKPSPDAVARLEDLWDRRLQTAYEATGRSSEDQTEAPAEREEFSEELGAFGWWLVAGHFDTAESLRRMERGLALGGDVGSDAFTVTKSLAKLSTEQPLLTMRCLEHIIGKILGGDPERRWQILAITESALTVMKVALRSTDDEAGQIASDLTHRLVANGWKSFEVLLDDR